jgi:hypothetical protein
MDQITFVSLGALAPLLMGGKAPSLIAHAAGGVMRPEMLASAKVAIFHRGRPRLERGQPGEPEPAQDAADGRARQAEPVGDLRPGQTLPAQALDRGGDRARQPAGQAGGGPSGVDCAASCGHSYGGFIRGSGWLADGGQPPVSRACSG